MEAKVGASKAELKIYTDDRKYVIRTSSEDPNSDIISISTNKSLKSPSGTFDIRFVPRKNSENRTWFDNLAPHDFVEISLAGIGEELRVVMRGLIDTVSKSESWAAGVPQREILIHGRDLGGLLEDFQIYWIPELAPTEAILAKLMPWDINYPLVLNAQGAFSYIMVKLKEYVDLTVGGQKLLNFFDFAALSMYPNDETNLFYLIGYEGDFWNAFSRYQDKPFHEMFVYDAPDKSWLIMRPSRLKDAMGNLPSQVKAYEGSNLVLSSSELILGASYEYPTMKEVSGNTFYPNNFSIYAVDKISISVSNSCNEIFNYYFTIPEAPQLLKIDIRGWCIDPYRKDPKNCENPFFQLNPNLPSYIGKYGFRKYEVTTVFLDLDIGKLKSADQNLTYDNIMNDRVIKKVIRRNRTLVAWFLHNEFLYSGTMEIRGTNKAIIGTYVTDEDDRMEYYVEGVNHNFVAFQSYTTSLILERGLSTSGKAIWNKYFFGGTSNNVDAPVRLPDSVGS